jgi:hypothetical protein
MSKQVIHITAFDEPVASVRRQQGAVNVGIYCRCGEFVAFSTAKPGQAAVDVEFTAAQPILIVCPYCRAIEHRHVEEIHQLLLTKRNKRRLM